LTHCGEINSIDVSIAAAAPETVVCSWEVGASCPVTYGDLRPGRGLHLEFSDFEASNVPSAPIESNRVEL